MTWLEHHRLSEQHASDAEVARLRGEYARAQELYAIAAKAEERALDEVALDKPRTYGVTSVSAVALRFKAAEFNEAKLLAYRCLASERLPEFASRQIEDLLQSIKSEQAGIVLKDAQLLVSVKGGEIEYGGAPLDLIVKKYQGMRALIYRTAEYMKKLPHRKRGEPDKALKDTYRPWLFHAEPGSYQFNVSLQKTGQLKLNMFDDYDIEPSQIFDRLFHIVKACAETPGYGLPNLMPEDDYRGSFLKLTRDMAPTSEGNFTRLDIRMPSEQQPITLMLNTRHAISDVIAASHPPSQGEEEIEICGTLRALHLDSDWIEVAQDNGENIRINRAGDEIDDRIGPMVNHSVVVRVAKSGNSMRFLDIEAS